MNRWIAIATLILAIAGFGLWQWKQSSALAPVATNAGKRVRSADCTPLPATPQLPTVLTPLSPTVEGVVQALDGSLDPSHKTFLRCFADEDELVARTHFGMGRWLRGSLHLHSRNPLTAQLQTAGAKNPDDMSAMILRAYSRSLHGLPMASGAAK